MLLSDVERNAKQLLNNWLETEKEKVNKSFEMYKYQHLVSSSKKLGFKLITEDEFTKLTEKAVYNKSTFDKDVTEKLQEHKQQLELQLNHELDKKELLCRLEIAKLTERNLYLEKRIEELKNNHIEGTSEKHVSDDSSSSEDNNKGDNPES